MTGWFSTMTDVCIAGQFLVATPVIHLPPFARSVVLVLEHDETGAVGVILNRDSGLLVSDLLPDIETLVADPPHVFIGGPVSTDTAVALARAPKGSFLRPTPLGTIGLVDPTNLPDGVTAMRIFAGYSGWDPDQLEAELDEGAWWPMLADVRSIFSDTHDLWRETVRRAPGRIPLFGTFPDDPSTN